MKWKKKKKRLNIELALAIHGLHFSTRSLNQSSSVPSLLYLS